MCVLTCLLKAREAHCQSVNTLWAEGTVPRVDGGLLALEDDF